MKAVAIECKWLMMSAGLDCQLVKITLIWVPGSLLESVLSWIEQVKPWLAKASHGRSVCLLFICWMGIRCWCCWEQARQSPCFPYWSFIPREEADKCIEEHKLVYVMERDCRWGWPRWFGCHRSQKVCPGRDIEPRPVYQRWAPTHSLEAEGSTQLGQ